MNWNIPKIKEYSFAAIGLVIMIGMIAFVDGKSKVQRCQSVNITMLDNNDQYYISGDDIKKFITKDGSEPLVGRVLTSIDLGKLEKRVKDLEQVEFSEVYGDLQGNLHVSVKPYIPYARLVSRTSGDGKYLNEEGRFFPLSKYHSARVLLLSGSYFYGKSDLLLKEDADLLKVIHTVKDDSFWNAQIAQMEVNRAGDIKFVPVLGNHIVEFGKAEDIEEKFNKLKVFYKQIMAVKGWDTFSKVKVQYANQIVCE